MMSKHILALGLAATACTGNLDPGDGDGDGDGPGMDVCAGSEISAEFSGGPSDIIWIVDQSGSMDQETAHVQGQINDFVGVIGASNIDYRVVMIAAPTADNPICVPGPLAGPGCGNNTQFRLVDQEVDSNDGPQLALSRYPMYSDFLRPNSTKHFVFVTDDDSDLSAAGFMSGVQGLQPAGMFDNFKVHGIYAFGAPPDGCTGAFGTGAAEGTVYTQLIAQTVGASGVICTGDWSQVFQDITTSVVTGSRVSCELAVPAPPAGEVLDLNQAVVRYQAGGATSGLTLPRVSTSADCGSTGGWYYDNNDAPTKILLCPSTCDTVQADPMANLKVEFGCSQPIF